MSRVLRPNAVLIQEARAAGEDCKNLGIGGDKLSKGGNSQTIIFFCFVLAQQNVIISCPLINTIAEMARIFGSDCTPNGLRFQLADRIKPLGNRQLDMLAEGNDPKDIILSDSKSAKGGKGQTILIYAIFCTAHFTSSYLDV